MLLNRWVGFEDVRSIEVKAKYIIEKKLGGGMLWALDFDDFSGAFCHQGKYPILTTLNFYLRPELGVKLPKYEVLWNRKPADSAKSETPKPTYETDLIISPKDSSHSLSPSFLNSHNVFGLIQNEGIK